MRCLVAGAGGFVGGHLVKRLLDDGHDVVAVDIKERSTWHQRFDCTYLDCLDLRELWSCDEAFNDDPEWVFNLAADMGGMGFITTHKAECMLSVLINTNMLRAAKDAQVQRYFFSSSACVYPGYIQNAPEIDQDGYALRESQAYPADPEDGYGWEKLFSERMCRHFWQDYQLETRIGRYHNVYGPHGTYEGGREKAPAAVCRKVAQAVIDGTKEIEIWGDGEQTRSFMYIDDCIDGTLKLTDSYYEQPLNIGSSELVPINQLVDLVSDIAGVTLKKVYVEGPQGVRGRNSDNTLCKEVLHWEPSISLSDGLIQTYEWIYAQLQRR